MSMKELSMRYLLTPLGATIWLFGAQVLASEVPAMERVKTGILPAGGFYSIYEVGCHDQTSASIARLERGRRWCSTYNGELSCVDQARHAMEMACADHDLAAIDEIVDPIESN